MTSRIVTTPAFTVSVEDIESLFLPYVIEEVPIDSARFLDARAQQAAKLAKRARWAVKLAKRARQAAKLARRAGHGTTASLDPDSRRATAHVDRYTRLWSSVSLADEVSSAKSRWFEWGERALLARTIARKHLHQLLLVRVLEWLRPATLLELGSGYGFNLLLLSMQFPEIALSGIELTEAGLAATRALARDPGTAALLKPLAVAAVKQPPCLSAFAVRQGSGDALPLDDHSVDAVITVLALEQMNDIRDDVLRELARVARRHVVMIEPFRDWNADGIRRGYIEQQRYFDASIEDLARFGLRPIVATADFPNKMTFHVGLVVAEVM